MVKPWQHLTKCQTWKEQILWFCFCEVVKFYEFDKVVKFRKTGSRMVVSKEGRAEVQLLISPSAWGFSSSYPEASCPKLFTKPPFPPSLFSYLPPSFAPLVLSPPPHPSSLIFLTSSSLWSYIDRSEVWLHLTRSFLQSQSEQNHFRQWYCQDDI